MFAIWPTTLCAILLCSISGGKKLQKSEESSAARWLLGTYEPVVARISDGQTSAAWDHHTNMADAEANAKFVVETKKLDDFVANAALKAKRFLKNVKKFHNRTVERQLKMIADQGFDIEDDIEYSTFKAKISVLDKQNFSICAWKFGKQDCSQKFGWDDIETIFTNRTDYNAIKYIWDQIYVYWASYKPISMKLIPLLNKKANENGHKDFGAYQRRLYEDPNLPATLERLWMEILPLYEQIHTYVRRLMRKEFPGKINSSTIPAHLTNGWAQIWNEDPKLNYPYPKETELNVTKLLLDKGITAEQMYRKADNFADSMGLKRFEDSVWNKSYFVQPEGRQFDTCEPFLYPLYNGTGFKVKTCNQVNVASWAKAQEVGGLAMLDTYLSSQPRVFRRFPAKVTMGTVFALASKTTKRLQTDGLLNGTHKSDLLAYEMNDLMAKAMYDVVSVGKYYVIEFWRWSAFDGSSMVENWDKTYGDLMLKYLGVELPHPIPKNSFIEGDDSGIGSTTDRLRHIVNLYLQFQLYEGLCNLSGYKGPLHQCDFYGSKAAGEAIRKAFSLGSSKPPMEILKIITGQREMSGNPLMRYYKPLYDWLKEENDKAKDCYGWGYNWPAKVLKNLEKNRC